MSNGEDVAHLAGRKRLSAFFDPDFISFPTPYVARYSSQVLVQDESFQKRDEIAP